MRSSVSSHEDQIREYAHRLYEWRIANQIAGDALSDWLEAERQIHKLDTPGYISQSPPVETPAEPPK